MTFCVLVHGRRLVQTLNVQRVHRTAIHNKNVNRNQAGVEVKPEVGDKVEDVEEAKLRLWAGLVVKTETSELWNWH